MADSDDVPPVESSQPPGEEEKRGEDERLTDEQRDVLERCVYTLKHAKNDSVILAALLVISRLCPASQLSKPTLRRIFEAVGLSFPARLLMTAVRGWESSGLAPNDLLSLGTALLAAFSTDTDMASHPQLLNTIPVLLCIIANQPMYNEEKLSAEKRNEAGETMTRPENKAQAGGITHPASKSTKATEASQQGDGSSTGNGFSTPQETLLPSKLNEAVAADCYHILSVVCALPSGSELLLNRGAVHFLCQAVAKNETFSHEKGLPLISCILSDTTKERAWSKHPEELLTLLVGLSNDFCNAKEQTRLDMCTQVVHFLPPAGAAVDSEPLRGVVGRLWGVLRPMVQSKLTPKQLRPVLILSACLLDLYGWDQVGSPKFCCLLVNRACVEVRMGLEEPPGNEPSLELQHTLTGCYRIMEAAMEQACSVHLTQTDASPQSSASVLCRQQTRQVLRVLEEAFSAVIYHLQQVDPSRFGDPFIFATFRALCSWLAEETSSLKEEVTGLLPFLVNYSRSHMQNDCLEQSFSDWMAELSIDEERTRWTGKEALRYLIPGLCHLSTEEAPRKVLLSLDTPSLLVDFLSQGWTSLKEKSGSIATRDTSMETTCSALINFAVTEPERVRKDPCFRTLETLLSEALPVLVHKPVLLILAASFCTLGLMIGRLKSAPSASVEAGQRRFFSTALRFLRGALDSSSSPGPVNISRCWGERWDEAAELWRLGLQALAACVRSQPWIISLVREEGWLKHTLGMLSECSSLPDAQTQDVLEEALCAMADQCPLCKQEIGVVMRGDKGAVIAMKKLKTLVEKK